MPDAPNPLASLLGGGDASAPKYKETTYAEYESEKASQASQQVLIGGFINILLSFQGGVHLPMAIQLISGPMGIADDPVVRKWFLGSAKPGEKLYGESLTRPPGFTAPDAAAAPGAAPAPALASGATAAEAAAPAAAPVAAAPAAAAAASSTPAASADAPVAAVDAELDEAIMAVWESKEQLDVGVFEHLVAQVSSSGPPRRSAALSPLTSPTLQKGARAANYHTTRGGWTPLMVVAGSSTHGLRDVARVLALGAHPAERDAEGWTALHWAAFHGVAHAIEAVSLCYGARTPSEAAARALRGIALPSCGSAADFAELLAVADASGRTARRVANEERNAAAAEALAALGAPLGAEPPAAPAVADAAETAE